MKKIYYSICLLISFIIILGQKQLTFPYSEVRDTLRQGLFATVHFKDNPKANFIFDRELNKGIEDAILIDKYTGVIELDFYNDEILKPQEYWKFYQKIIAGKPVETHFINGSLEYIVHNNNDRKYYYEYDYCYNQSRLKVYDSNNDLLQEIVFYDIDNQFIYSKSNYLNGMQHGLQIGYNKDGSIFSKEHYKEGKLVEVLIDEKPKDVILNENN